MTSDTETITVSSAVESSAALSQLSRTFGFFRAPIGCEHFTVPADSDFAGRRTMGTGSFNRQHSVRRLPLPEAGSFSPHYDGAALAEAYAICLPARVSRDSFNTAQKLFGFMPVWFRALTSIWGAMTIGNNVPGFYRNLPKSGEWRSAVHIGHLHIYFYLPGEIIVGWENPHLSFRIAILLKKAASTKTAEIIVTTAAHYSDKRGRRYLKVISPFYRSAIRSCIQHFAMREWKKQAHVSGRDTDRLDYELNQAQRPVPAWKERLRNLLSADEGPACAACAAKAARGLHSGRNVLARDEIFYPPYHDIYPPLSETDYIIEAPRPDIDN
jgi:hypothetical protein